MTDSKQNPNTDTPKKLKFPLVLIVLVVMIIVAGAIAQSNSKKRVEFNAKVEEIKKTDQVFLKQNDCWLLNQNPQPDYKVDSVIFVPSNSSHHKNFFYKCADGRGYQSNIYIGKFDAQHLSAVDRAALNARLPKS